MRIHKQPRTPTAAWPILGGLMLLTSRFTALLAVLLLACVAGIAAPSRADEIEPEPSSDAPVVEKAPPKDQPAPTPPKQATEPASHVHEVNPAPSRSFKEVVKDISTRDKLTGDWGGLRTDLHDHGIDLEVNLSQFYQHVTSGGIRKDGEYAGLLDYIVNVTGEKLGLWKGLFLNLHAQYQYGHTIYPDADILPLTNVQLLYPTPDWNKTEVTGWSITQQLYQKDVTTVVLTAGKIHVNDLLGQAFPFLEYDTTGFMNYNVNFPVAIISRFIALSHLGTALIMLNKTEIRAAFAVLDTYNSSTNSGFNEFFDNGATLLGAYRFFFDIKDMPGRLLFLGTTSTGKYTALQDTAYGPIGGFPGLQEKTERYPWAAIAYYDQIVWQTDATGKRNVRFVASVGLADKGPSFARWQYTGQIIATGLFDCLPTDRIGIGGHYVGATNHVKDLSREFQLQPDLGNYWGFELFYTHDVTPAVHLTADLQVTDDFETDIDTAVIPGVRLVIEF
jgi:porin